MNLPPATAIAVIDEAQRPKSTHKEANSRARSTHQLRQSRLI